MSEQAIVQYYKSLDQYERFGGTKNESSIRRAFAVLLETYCLPENLVLVDEIKLKDSRKTPDGTVKDALRLDWGHWESKDSKDDIDEEIKKKIAAGYPKVNIIFENSETIVLFQQEHQVMRGNMRNAKFLHKVLTQFISYQRPEIKSFREAIEKFKEDVPDIVKALRIMIAKQSETNEKFKKARAKFWEQCKESINPGITVFDIREMLVQHILTSEIFNTIFGESHFHRENNIAKELEGVVNTFFAGAVRRNTLAGINNYYKAIKAEAARIDNHHEKQKFLKVIYEHFYKAYNPKGADRLGVVYTPNEIVKFMIESTDYLLEKHFRKLLHNKDVEILDPATGTGTFITDIIEHIPQQYLEYKYKNEIHANEVSILPYYIASLNIEYTYQQKMEKYEPFENIVFVDTLDNLGFKYPGKQNGIEGFGFSAENIHRIKEQNKRKISVIIGNPPYNANQMNENENNKNREYPQIDERIKNTYIKESTAQKTKLYDMYARFLRWAGDRIYKNGIIAFITNRSYIDSRTFDGFRKTVSEEFDYIYIVDTQSDVRKNPKIAGTTHNVFGIQTGVAIMFLVKTEKTVNKNAIISYATLTDKMLKSVKLDWFRYNKLSDIAMENIIPDRQNNWLNIVDNNFNELIPVANKETKLAKNKEDEKAVFGLYSLGIVTSRDNWVYDFDKKTVESKVKFLINIYNQEVKRLKGIKKKQINDRVNYIIKWSRAIKNDLSKGKIYKYDKTKIVESLYRPFVKMTLYFAKELNEMQYQIPYIFGLDKKLNNQVITISGTSSSKIFSVLVVNTIYGFDFLEKTQCLPLYRYNKQGSRIDNITDWGLKRFTDHYQNADITKEDIFHYTYGALHNPAYRKKYEINLKREFPRLPFYKDFYKWAAWGKTLMDLHINYEKVKPYKLKVFNLKKQFENPKPKLRAIPEKGEIVLDDNTKMSGVPLKAWDYKLGNRSALHWILDQYKEKKPKDKTIAEKFNTYSFSDYKKKVILLLKKICTVSVNTVNIINEMAAYDSCGKKTKK